MAREKNERSTTFCENEWEIGENWEFSVFNT